MVVSWCPVVCRTRSVDEFGWCPVRVFSHISVRFKGARLHSVDLRDRGASVRPARQGRRLRADGARAGLSCARCYRGIDGQCKCAGSAFVYESPEQGG